MNSIEKAAYVAVWKAVEKCPVGVGASAKVKAGDVALLTSLAPQPYDEVIAPLAKGATKNKPGEEVFQLADPLKYLLEKIPVPADE